jgi:hypothetical protein
MLKNFHWGHGIALAMVSFIAFILFMVFVFPNGKQNAEMVSDNYYEDEIHFQKTIDAKKNAQLLSELPAFEQSQNGIKISFHNSIQPENKKVDFSLFRTDDKNLDVNKSVNLDSNNSFNIPKSILVPGSYTLKVSWKEKGKAFQVDYDVLWK